MTWCSHDNSSIFICTSLPTAGQFSWNHSDCTPRRDYLDRRHRHLRRKLDSDQTSICCRDVRGIFHMDFATWGFMQVPLTPGHSEYSASDNLKWRPDTAGQVTWGGIGFLSNLRDEQEWWPERRLPGYRHLNEEENWFQIKLQPTSLAMALLAKCLLPLYIPNHAQDNFFRTATVKVSPINQNTKISIFIWILRFAMENDY
jgi:hypothetical protein